VKLVQAGAFVAGLLLAKLLPQATSLHVGAYVVAMIACFVAPVYAFFLEK
jgi:hypothetical protein